jgi:hypothetical protein
MVLDDLTRNWSLLKTGWSKKYDMLGENLVNLPKVAGGILEIALLLLDGELDHILTLSAFPEDPICDSCCFGFHCFENLLYNKEIQLEVERVEYNPDVFIIREIVDLCIEKGIGIDVKDVQESEGKYYPLRVEIQLGDLRRVLELWDYNYRIFILRWSIPTSFIFS